LPRGDTARRRARRLVAAPIAALVLLAIPAASTADPPSGDFTFTPAVAAVGANVAFTAGATDPDGDPVAVDWDFGDGSTGSGTSVEHAYAAPGTETVTMTLSANGDSVTVSHALRVNAPPVAHFTFAALDRLPGEPFDVPMLGAQVAFDASSSSDPDGSIVSYSWDFNGDGDFGDDNRTSLITTLSTPGVVNIGLRVTDDDGATSTYVQPVRVDQAPIAAFTYSPTSPVAGSRVTFTSTSTDPDGASDLTGLSWDLDADGTFGDATGPTATRVFPMAGTYPVALQAVDSVGVQAVQMQSVTVRILGPPPAAGAPFKSTFASTPTSSSAASSAPMTTGKGARKRLTVVPDVRVSIAGRVFDGATRITRLVVLAPVGSTVSATCRGHGCPAKAVRRHVRGTNGVRLRQLERSLAAGSRVVVLVSRKGFIGKQIQFTIQRTQPPVRHDSCLLPGADRTRRCPS
jgi:PKD repeat protein